MYSEENKKEKKKENLTNWNIYSGNKRKKEKNIIIIIRNTRNSLGLNGHFFINFE